jgi:hypothetical protein
MINKRMNYTKHYTLLIERAKERIINDYTEKHHIVPRCLGGTDVRENIVALTPEEHYVAHQLLVKMYPKEHKLVHAANMMTVASNGKRSKNKRYRWLKERHIRVCRARVGEKNPSYGKRWHYSPSTLENGKFLAEDVPIGWAKGRKPPKALRQRYCTICQTEIASQQARYCSSCRLDRTKNRNCTVSTETRERMSQSQKLSNGKRFLGKTHTKETKQKISERAKVTSKRERNSQYGTRWIHSLELKESKKLPKDEPLPSGWAEGRKIN